jgi:hypothetical protein
MTRNSLIAAAAGTLGGVLLVAAWHGSFFGVLLGLVFSPLPLAMTAFGLGLSALPVAVIAGAVVVMTLTGSVVLGAFYLAFDAAPIVILARIGITAEHAIAAGYAQPVLGGRTIAMPLIALTIVAAALAATGLAMFPAGPDGIEASMIARIDQLVKENGMLRDLPETARAAFVSTLVRVMPGAAAWNWCFRALASAVVGQALLARDGYNRWPTPAYRTLSVPGWYVGVFWLAVVAGWLAPGDMGFVVANVAIVMSLPLVLQGLAVVHCAAARFGYGRYALVVFYGVTLVVAGPALVLIVALGVMEHFSQLRRRMAEPNGG